MLGPSSNWIGKPPIRSLRMIYYRYWMKYMKMRRGHLNLRQHRRLFFSFVFTTAVASFLIIYFSRPVANVEKAILKGNTLHSALRIMKNFPFDGKNPLLVIFTSFQQEATKDHIFRNTLRNWGQLRPLVLPVLYNDNLNAYFVELAKTWGWTVLPVPKRHRGDIPILRHMFLNATGQFKASFYGYANGDVLFDESIIFTLWSINQNASIHKPFLVGRRSNFYVKREDKVFEPSYVRTIAERSDSELFISDAQDYFITTKNGFPWYAIPDFVIGRIAYDNWLVATSINRKDGLTIDATNTILCLHQSGDDGNFSGFSAQKYTDINIRLSGPDFNFRKGKTDCAPWETVFNHTTGDIVVQRRQQNFCSNSIFSS